MTCVNRRGAATPANNTLPTRRLVNDTATLSLPCPAADSTYWDTWRGTPLVATAVGTRGQQEECAVALFVAPREFTALALLDAAESASAEWAQYVAERAAFMARPLSTLSYATSPLPQAATAALAPSGALDLTNTTRVAAHKAWPFAVSGVQVEGFGGLAGPGEQYLPDVQLPWEALPQRHHARTIDVDSFVIDRFPVTNARYEAFLARTKVSVLYVPLHFTRIMLTI